MSTESTPAGKTGKARLWLTFDDIQTPNGWHAARRRWSRRCRECIRFKVDYRPRRGIEANGTKRKRPRGGSGRGAGGIGGGSRVHRGYKDAALGAAAAAAAAFMVSSGLGQEITLEKDTKIEVILERSLFPSGGTDHGAAAARRTRARPVAAENGRLSQPHSERDSLGTSACATRTRRDLSVDSVRRPRISNRPFAPEGSRLRVASPSAQYAPDESPRFNR